MQGTLSSRLLRSMQDTVVFLCSVSSVLGFDSQVPPGRRENIQNFSHVTQEVGNCFRWSQVLLGKTYHEPMSVTVLFHDALHLQACCHSFRLYLEVRTSVPFALRFPKSISGFHYSSSAETSSSKPTSASIVLLSFWCFLCSKSVGHLCNLGVGRTTAMGSWEWSWNVGLSLLKLGKFWANRHSLVTFSGSGGEWWGEKLALIDLEFFKIFCFWHELYTLNLSGSGYFLNCTATNWLLFLQFLFHSLFLEFSMFCPAPLAWQLLWGTLSHFVF